MSADTAILVNGQARDNVDARDRGLQYGDGLFETVAVFRGEPLLWNRHVDRLARGAQRLRIAMPSPALLHGEAMQLCAGMDRAVLKIVLTRGVSARGYAPDPESAGMRMLMRSAYPSYPVSFASDGVGIRLCRTRLGCNETLAGIKHLNRLEQVLARAEWGDGFADGLMCDRDGFVIEGTMSNLFLVANGVLKTPALTACGVEGVMRETVMDGARTLGLSCVIGPVTLDDLGNAQELFLTNSLIGVWPVRYFQSKEYAIGPVTRAVQEAVRHEHCFDR